MGYTATKLVEIATAEIGYHEKASNSNLDSKTANSGNKNYTKYGRDLFNAGFFNGNKNGFDWCAQFPTWCVWKLTGKNKKKTEYILCVGGDLSAGCGFALKYYKAAGRFDKTPKVGDQIFFKYNLNDTSYTADHTGIVVRVTDKLIETIEGNSGNEVKRKTYDRSYYAIIGYGHPRFDEAPAAATPPKVETTYVGVSLPILRVGSSGQSVKALQRLLYVMNYYGADGKPLKIDGKFGPNVERAVKKYQELNNLKITGVCDQKMWNKMLGGKTISMPAKKEETIVEEKRYKTLEEIPEAYRAGIKKLVDAGSLKGKGGTLGLDLTEDMIRTLLVSTNYTDKEISKVPKEIANTTEVVGSIRFKNLGVAHKE